ncbi:MAG: NAD(P)H-hydrate dehydratase [Gordonia sp. (in: high G+C Gram-positive bacteria)]|uniref:NAD(P)H-hydrate dehydratase n=1 Tax=Gordonia sp. (in: high G+C Gram-positive bacteria) TaxID=84139 RepID=UPI0039E62B82
MTGYFSVEKIRAAEEATGDLLTSGALMARAANGVARVALGELRARGAGIYGRTVGLVIGAGNNGGDALYAGAILAGRGVACHAVLLAPDKTHADALAAYRRAGGRVIDAFTAPLDVVLDAVVGLGGRGPLRPEAAQAFASRCAAEATVIAVDLPSGIDPDTGVVSDPSVRADVSVTFGEPRLAHLLAAPQCGRVEVVDLGLDLHDPDITVPDDRENAALWPVPGPRDDKYTQGVVGIVAGSATYPGAALLATQAAVAATSGMTRYVGPAAHDVVNHRPEVVAVERFDDAGRVQAWVVGPGLGADSRAHDLVETVLRSDVPVLVDADGLTILASRPGLLRGRTAPTLLTPHAGEFARLAAAPVGDDRLSAVRDLAATLGATVLLKGRITLVADPDGRVAGNDAGASWAATAGAGDVLSGIAGSLLAAGLTPLTAGTLAARAHAVAARIASGPAPGHPIGASDLAAALPDAITLLRQSRR